jgi:hypothetical protein
MLLLLLMMIIMMRRRRVYLTPSSIAKTKRAQIPGVVADWAAKICTVAPNIYGP